MMFIKIAFVKLINGFFFFGPTQLRNEEEIRRSRITKHSADNGNYK